MSRKRRNSSSPECDDSPRKRQSPSVSPYTSDEDDSDTQGGRPQIDLTTGQAGAFPGLGKEDQLFYGPAADGIDYLRMVRSEARGIPHLLTSNREKQSGVEEQSIVNQYVETGGYYSDGAYTAKPEISQQTLSRFEQSQLFYYDSLLTQFNLVRATMKCIPPLSAVEQLNSSQPISFPPESSQARKIWDEQLSHQDPHPVQVACMDADSVFQLLGLIQKRMFVYFKVDEEAQVQRLGSWIWAVLGKAPDRGMLGSDEIAELRVLAKRARLVSDHLEKDMKGSDTNWTDLEGETEEEENSIISEIRHARERLGTSAAETNGKGGKNTDGKELLEVDQSNSSSLKDWNRIQQQKQIVLDMIITIVGEVYGQRDLLDLQKPWADEES